MTVPTDNHENRDEGQAPVPADVGRHTPGPWAVSQYTLAVYAKDHKGEITVCDIRGWGHLTGKGHGALGLNWGEATAIQIANAILIAAAPNMLAVLKRVDGMCEALAEAGYFNEDRKEIWNEVCATIRKATGEA